MKKSNTSDQSSKLFSKPFAHFAPIGPLVLRLILGIILVAHGMAKLQAGPAEVWGSFFESLSIPAPVFTAWIVTLIEFVGGLFFFVGFLTRIAALLFSVIMIAAILLVSIDLGLISTANGPGADLNLALLAGSLTLVFIGPGKIALDHFLKLDTISFNTIKK